MSQILELPDEVHAALRRAAEDEGMAPADWIETRLASAPTAHPPKGTTSSRTLADLFAGKIGRISSAGEGHFSQETRRTFTDGLEEKKQAGHL